MRTIGLLGGFTWHSTAKYYELINQAVARELGPFRSARVVMHSIDYGSIRRARADGDWGRLGKELVSAARGLQRAGAEGLFLCSNTIHQLEPRIASQLSIPVLHIADAVADEAARLGIRELALFGTAFTMTQPFYRERLEAAGMRVHVPGGVEELDRIILEELAAGVVKEESRAFFLARLAELDAEGMVLGCTEIGMLLGADDIPLPVLDTTILHAEAAARWALSP